MFVLSALSMCGGEMGEGKSPEIAAFSINWRTGTFPTISYLSLSVLVLESDNRKGFLADCRQLLCVSLKVSNISHTRDQGIIATSTFDSHMLLPSYRYGFSKSLEGIAGTWHGLVDEGNGKRECQCRCYHPIPECYKVYHNLNYC